MLSACPSDPPAGDDGGTGGLCTTDADCSDSLFCNGMERCDPTGSAAGDDGCVPGEPPCSAGSCDEDADDCGEGCEDADGDGASAASCGGTDCDDENPNRFPGATEVCDAMNVDEDCDERTFGVRDADGDGSPDALCCNGDNCGDDCDDSRSAVSPTLVETCDGLDNDCDGMVDESVLLTFTEDVDGDGFGSDAPDAATVQACSAPPNYAASATDCDDGAEAINPGNAELCGNAVDENCSGEVNEDCDCSVASRACSDGGLVGVCASGTQTCDAVTGMWGECSISPSGEVCNGSDDDCDGTPDDGVQIPCYEDPDGDGYAATGAVMTMRCTCMSDETDRVPADAASTDCRESPETRAAQTYPGADETCDGIDNDCSSGGGAVDLEDRDGDGYTAQGFGECTGGPFPQTDCLDRNPDVNPAVTDYESEPYCTSGVLCTCGASTLRCLTPVGPGGSCPVCTVTTNGTAPSFDYDCNGTTTTEPAFASCAGGCCSENCSPSSVQSTSNCGSNVPHTCCLPSATGCGGGCVAGSGGIRPLGCR